MSERHVPRHNSHEREVHHESAHEHQERLNEQIDRAKHEKNEHAERLPELQKEAREHASHSREIAVGEARRDEPAHGMQIDRTVKEAARRRVLKRVQKRLRPDERLLSKFTHNPAVDAVSRAAEKTVARPSGLLGGSLLAFLGSSGYLWIAKHYGYEYNYFLFAVLFLAGMILGMTLELLTFSFRKKQ